MRPADDERREAARKLREIADEDEWIVVKLAAALGIDLMRCESREEGEAEVVRRIADLVDPTCHGIEEREHDGIGAPPRYTSRCSNCGQLWDETSGIPRFPAYCPSCGRRVMK